MKKRALITAVATAVAAVLTFALTSLASAASGATLTVNGKTYSCPAATPGMTPDEIRAICPSIPADGAATQPSPSPSGGSGGTSPSGGQKPPPPKKPPPPTRKPKPPARKNPPARPKPRPQHQGSKKPAPHPKPHAQGGPAPAPAGGGVFPAPGGGAGILPPGAQDLTGVPDFTIRDFKVPIFLLPIYQAAGIEYGIRWEVLAAINEIETDYGRNLSVSSAGAVGWMQFLPATFKIYGVDANHDGKKDPYNPVDAIFSAARYLKAAGGDKDIRKGIFAYNHAGWYVDSVLLRAKLIAGVPADLIGSLTGLTEARFPIVAPAKYADGLTAKDATRPVKAGGNASTVDQGTNRKGIDIYSRKGAPVVAVNDGVVTQVGRSGIVIQDVYGNSYTYSKLGQVSRFYPVPNDQGRNSDMAATAMPAHDPKPTAPASAGTQRPGANSRTTPTRRGAPASPAAATPNAPVKERLFAHPDRPRSRAAGGFDQMMNASRNVAGYATFRNYFSRAFSLNPKNARLQPLKRGAHVIGGTLLGRVGKPDPSKDPHIYFQIRPGGRGAPFIDPKPILDGWRLLEATAIYRPNGGNVLDGNDHLSIGELMLTSKPLLERRVLSDRHIHIYPCGRRDIQTGQIDRRVLITLLYLEKSGLDPTVSALKCGHGFLTSSGNVSEHSSGNAVDISAINGTPITGHQDKGGITEQTIRRLLLLQGTLNPHQIISLLDLGGPSFALPDHYNHIHVGFQPLFGPNDKLGREAMAVLKPGQWNDLIGRLSQIPNPVVRQTPSKYAIPDRGHGSNGGE